MKEKGQLQILVTVFWFFFFFFIFSFINLWGNWQETVENFSSLFCFCFSSSYFFGSKNSDKIYQTSFVCTFQDETVWNFLVTIFFLFLLLLPEIFCRKLARDCCEFLVTIFFCFLLLFLFFISSSFTWSLPRAG